MTLWWWSCPWCGDRMQQRHTEAEVAADRDRHIATAHPTVVRWAAHMVAISHYTFLEVHP